MNISFQVYKIYSKSIIMYSVINVLLNLTFQVYNVQYTNYQCYDIDMLLYLHFQVYNYSTTDDKFYYSAVGHAFVQYLTLRFYICTQLINILPMSTGCAR